MNFTNSILLSAAIGMTASAAQGQTPSPACDAPEYRQFDFWIGEWDVDGGQDGKTPVGTSSITRSASGCALHEKWTNVQGSEGRSLNVYDKTIGKWTQFWIGADGVVLRLEGGLQNKSMILEGFLNMPNDKIQLQRITWTPMQDGRVSQRWDISDDDGKTWAVSFIGYYKRK